MPALALNQAELTLVTKFPLIVEAQKRTIDAGNVGHELVSFLAGEDLNGKILFYFDNLANGSAANPNIVANYGDDDNIGPIMTGHVLSVVANFDTILTGPNAGKGTGSYDFRFIIDSVNSNYVDIQTGSVIGIKATGTINRPAFFSPTAMWDGTSTAPPNVLLKVDGSQIYFPDDSCVGLIKEVSVDNGQTWVDANTLDEAPGTTNGALYRFSINNCGLSTLNDVTLTDPVLGDNGQSFQLNIGSLAAGESQTVLPSSLFPNSLLSKPGLCNDVPPPGNGDPNKFNNATVVGTVAGTGLTVTDSDPAWVKCICLDLEKLVSVNGGLTFEDADQCFDPPAPEIGRASCRVRVYM